MLSVWAPRTHGRGRTATAGTAHGASGIMHAAEARHAPRCRTARTSAAGSGRSRAAASAAWPRRPARSGLRSRHGARRKTDHAGDRVVRRPTSAAALLRGLFDADGSVQGSQDKGVSVRLTQVDDAAAAERRSACCCAWASPRRSTAIAGRPQRELMPDGHGGQRELSDAGRCTNSSSAATTSRAFAERVGFADTAKAAAARGAAGQLPAQLEPRALHRHRRVASRPTASRRSTTSRSADVHAFDANGLVVHNCAEQPLPAYGCCCLGSIDLTRFVRSPFEADAAFDARPSPRSRGSPCACSTTCSTSASGRCRSARSRPKRSSKRRVGPRLHRARRRAGDARPALRHAPTRATMAARIAEPHARRGLRRVGRTGEGARRVPAVQCRPVPLRRQLRLAPAAAAEGADPRARPAQLAPALASRPPARSAWPSPTTRATASSRRSRGATSARSARATAPSRSTRSKTTRGACTAT